MQSPRQGASTSLKSQERPVWEDVTRRPSYEDHNSTSSGPTAIETLPPDQMRGRSSELLPYVLHQNAEGKLVGFTNSAVATQSTPDVAQADTSRVTGRRASEVRAAPAGPDSRPSSSTARPGHATRPPGERSWRWSLTGARNSAGASFNNQSVMHFVEARNLVVADGGELKTEAEETAEAKKSSDPEIPVRMVHRGSRWVSAVLLIVLIGVAGYAYYRITRRLLRIHATWEWIALALIPAGMVFFAMALKMGLQAVMSPLCGSIRALKFNSEFYSALPTPVLKGQQMPFVVVQIPVYKEDLIGVIAPTLRSVAIAMEHYRQAGGQSKLLICDDGLQVLEDARFVERMAFYRKNQIAFVARPPANRRGLFKKASNLNYGMHIADQVAQLQSEQAMSRTQALAEVWEHMDHSFLAGGDVTIPSDALILLLDADTRVPEACMSLTVGEFMLDPNLAYTQHFTAPIAEQSRNYWEHLISAFTRKIYSAGIAVGASQGEYAPLVGHNAFLRVASMKEIGYTCKLDNRVKYWSETTVSEDFDLFIRFAAKDMFGRYVMYTGDGFQEGVSLTYIDEVIKLRKFTYGACEMCFRPLIQWWRGPFSPIVISFVGSRLPWYWKVSLLTYLGSYFAMAAALPYMTVEAVLSVYSPGYLSYYGVRGFDVMLTCIVLFAGMATIHETIIEWRMKALQGASIIGTAWNNMRWIPFIAILYGGVPFSMSTAAGCYFFSVPITWGATAKEVKEESCWSALSSTWSMFKWQYIILSAFLGVYGLAIYWYSLPLYFCWGPLWYIGLHHITPILLNPYITSLAF